MVTYVYVLTRARHGETLLEQENTCADHMNAHTLLEHNAKGNGSG